MNAIISLSDRYAERYGLLVGRVFIGLLFVITGVIATLNFGGTTGMIASTGLPVALVLTVIVLILKLGGGLSLLLGYQVRYGAIALVAFTVLATGFFHIGDMVGFLKNLAIIGGLVMVYRAAPPISTGNNAAATPPYGSQ